MTNPLQVLVTGATGRTGALVVQKLQQQPDQFSVRGLARSQQKAKDLLGPTTDIYVGDITQPDTLPPALNGCDALVILTSAIPQLKGPPEPGQRPEFFYPEGGTPEQVDYQGPTPKVVISPSADTLSSPHRP